MASSGETANYKNELAAVGQLHIQNSPWDHFAEADMSIYPNPANDRIKLNVPGIEDVQLYIYNTSGQLMVDGREVDIQESINIGHLEKGLYIVKVVSEGEVFTTKLIKQ